MSDHDKARLTHVTRAAAYDARSTSLDWLRARRCAELTRSAHARFSLVSSASSPCPHTHTSTTAHPSLLPRLLLLSALPLPLPQRHLCCDLLPTDPEKVAQLRESEEGSPSSREQRRSSHKHCRKHTTKASSTRLYTYTHPSNGSRTSPASSISPVRRTPEGMGEEPHRAVSSNPQHQAHE